MDGHSLARLLPDIAWTLGLGTLWFAFATVAFQRFLEAGRRDGSIEFSA